MNRGESARLAGADVIGEAIFGGCLAMVHVPRAPLEHALPPSVRLAEPGGARVPCLLLFGEHTGATTCFAGVPMPWGIRYHELMFAVPFVVREGAPHEHLFVQRMICDFWPGVWVGNNYYGFNKSFAQITWDGRRFLASDASHAPIFRADVRRLQRAPAGALAWIQAAAALPVLGRRSDGTIVRSRFDWDFAGAAIDVVALDLSLTQKSQYLFGLDRTTWDEDAHSIQGMRWRLSWPNRASAGDA